MDSIPKKYIVRLTRKAEKQLKALGKTDYAKIRSAIEKLAENPRGHYSIKLTDSDNEYRMRVGDFRILYTIEDNILTVFVFDVLNRRDAYK